jgi:hypothetical protein
MPKDATKNVDRYKVRGGELNEFEFTQNRKATKSTKRTKKATKSTKEKRATAKKK